MSDQSAQEPIAGLPFSSGSGDILRHGMQVDAVAQIVANWRFPVSNTISISNVTQYERKLIEAVAAAYALIAHSDGEPAGIERQQLFTILRNRPALSSLPRTEIAQASAVHEANFRLDPEIAQEIAREKLIAIADESAASDIILALCRELIAADGVLHPAERRQFREIKTLLGVTRTPAA